MTLEHNPYAAPAADIGPIQVEGAEPFKPLGTVGALAVFAIAGVIFLRLCCLGLGYQIVSTVQAVKDGTLERSDELAASVELTVNLLRTGAIAVAVLFLTSGIVTLVWIHRAHSNLPGLHNHNLKYTPGWFVAYWFIPFISLVRPYQAMCELMNGSDPERYSSSSRMLPSQSGGLLLGFWWLFFLAMVVVMRVSSIMSKEEDLSLLLGIDIALAIVTTISGLFTIVVIRRIQAYQDRRRELVLAPPAAEDSPFQPGPTW